jgi:hypothetical protein
VNAVTIYGVVALTFMMAMYALERRGRRFVVLFALGCVLSSGAALSFIVIPPVRAGATSSTADIPSCNHLVVASTPVEGADGAGYMTILFVNLGSRCVLTGYPSVQFFEPRATHLIGHDVHLASMVFAEPAPSRVALANGMVASIGVTWQDDPKRNQSCRSTQWANVVLPSKDRQNFQPSVNAKPCGSDVWVTPFETRAQPKLN